ncbi:MAG TPA: DUF4349 domain-containing protein [Kofleriaceae bacterium]|jgi:hypothetical protein|nr:DUF4349 domain-containing protein [Kofleriaceae bacterium]
MFKLSRVMFVAALASSACAKGGSHASHEAATAATAESHDTLPGAAPAAKAALDPQPHDDRKVIRTGKLEVVIATYESARTQIEAIVKASGGYIDSTRVERAESRVSDATIVIRIPADSFESILPQLRQLGEVASETTNAADITDQYVDTEARLASDQQLEKRLLELAAARNGNLEQILGVERELARVRGEIESYQGHLKMWNDQVSLSTLTLELSTKRAELPPPESPTLGSQTKGAFHDSVAALRGFGEWCLINGVALLPWLVVLIPGFFIARRFLRRLLRGIRTVLPPAVVRAPSYGSSSMKYVESGAIASDAGRSAPVGHVAVNEVEPPATKP